MGLTIYSYGYSEIIYQMLNALAMLRNSIFYPMLVQTMSIIAGIILAVRVAAGGADGRGRQYLMQLMVMIAFVNGLLLPKTTMYVVDNVERRLSNVDNIPLAFALPIGITERFGRVLTSGFEQAFSFIGGRSSISYHEYGTVFGARLSKEVLEAKIRDPEVTSNMRNFIERCVVMPAMIGNQFTKEELFATDDIWKLVSQNAGTIARVDMTIENVHSTHTCKDAVDYFEKKFNNVESNFIDRVMSKFRGGGGDSNTFNHERGKLRSNIKNSILSIYRSDSQQSVSDILKHNMMINSLNDYRSGKFASARAQMHSEAGGLLSGDMAEKTLTGSLAVMKVLIYGSFIFVIPLLILTGGIKKYGMWVLAAFSLQLWPPLFSMLNMIIDVAYDPAEIVSYSSWSSEVKKFDSIASTAANMTLMIPFLAMWITRLGEGGLMHLAGSIMATAQSAASSIASEKSSGTVSYDNHNVRNSSYDMHNSGKVDHNLNYVTGEQTYSTGDGTKVKVAGNGSAIMLGGPGTTSSVGETNYNLARGMQTLLQSEFENQQSILDSVSNSYDKSKSDTISKAVNYLKEINDSKRDDNSDVTDQSTEQAKVVSAILSDIDAINKTNNYGWEANARAYLASSLEADLEFFGVGAKAAVGIENSASINVSGNAGTEHKDVSERSTSNTKTHLFRYLRSTSHNETSEKRSALEKDLRGSFEETTTLGNQWTISQEKVKTVRDVMNYVESNSANINRDVTQDVLDGVIKITGLPADEAKKLVDKSAPAAMQVFYGLSRGELARTRKEISHNMENNLSDNAYKNKSEKFYNKHGKTVVDGVAENRVLDMVKNDDKSGNKIQKFIQQDNNNTTKPKKDTEHTINISKGTHKTQKMHSLVSPEEIEE